MSSTRTAASDVSVYLDSSALLKLYVAEDESEQVRSLVTAAEPVVICSLGVVEVRRNLARLLPPLEHGLARAAFMADVGSFAVVALDAVTCERAAEIAERVGVRSLDALHLAAALRSVGPGGDMVTYDVRQAQAARTLGLVVTGT